MTALIIPTTDVSLCPMRVHLVHVGDDDSLIDQFVDLGHEVSQTRLGWWVSFVRRAAGDDDFESVMLTASERVIADVMIHEPDVVVIVCALHPTVLTLLQEMGAGRRGGHGNGRASMRPFGVVQMGLHW